MKLTTEHITAYESKYLKKFAVCAAELFTACQMQRDLIDILAKLLEKTQHKHDDLITNVRFHTNKAMDLMTQAAYDAGKEFESCQTHQKH